MSAHLTHEEMTDRLLSLPSLTVDAHLLDCQACQAELEMLRLSVNDFSNAARGWSEDAMAVSRNLTAIPPRRKNWTVEWMMAAAFLLMVILPLLYVRHRGSRPVAGSVKSSPLSTQAQIEQDNELLAAVNSEIAEGVPAPMQPLQISLSNGSGSSANQAK